VRKDVKGGETKTKTPPPKPAFEIKDYSFDIEQTL
jgi:hypothetical protein